MLGLPDRDRLFFCFFLFTFSFEAFRDPQPVEHINERCWRPVAFCSVPDVVCLPAPHSFERPLSSVKVSDPLIVAVNLTRPHYVIAVCENLRRISPETSSLSCLFPFFFHSVPCIRYSAARTVWASTPKSSPWPAACATTPSSFSGANNAARGPRP